jgi:Polyketide cyclase / dehydrase and lipid transport
MMASIRREISIAAPPELVWDALRDFGAVHARLVPGFVVDAQTEGPDRIVTFFNGSVLRERLVDRDDDARRLVWWILPGPLGFEHHNGCAQVFAEGGGSRFVWTTDVLPDALAERLAAMMERGLEVIRQTLESAARGEH